MPLFNADRAQIFWSVNLVQTVPEKSELMSHHYSLNLWNPFHLPDKPAYTMWSFLAIALFFFSQFVMATESVVATNTLRVAYVEFPPYTYQNIDGNPAGTFIDVTRKVVKEAGYEAEFVYLPISRVYLYLVNGRIDVWVGLTHVPKLLDDVLESRITPVSAQLSAWYRSDTGALENFGQLKGKTVIVINGYTYGGLIDWLNSTDDINVTEAPNHRSAIEMLKRERGDYLLDYQEPLRQILTQPSDSIIQESNVRTRRTAWIFSLANPHAALLRDQIDEAYLRLIEAGEVPAARKPASSFVIPGLPEQYQ